MVSGGANGYGLVAHPLDRSIILAVDNSSYRTDPGAYEFDDWTHVAAVVGENAFEIYVNGEKKDGTFTRGAVQLPPDVQTNLRIGSWNDTDGRKWNGLLDDIRIYNQPLPLDQITGIFNQVQATQISEIRHTLISAPRLQIPDSSFLSGSLYEDAEDGTLDGWTLYGDGEVQNILDPLGNRVISTSGEFPGDPFRLGLPNYQDWNNSNEFVASFRLLMGNSAAVYFRVDTSVGEKFLCYRQGPEAFEVSDSVICFGLGIEADGEWHTIERNLVQDLSFALPDVRVLTVKDFYVYGNIQLDDLMLIKDHKREDRK